MPIICRQEYYELIESHCVMAADMKYCMVHIRRWMSKRQNTKILTKVTTSQYKTKNKQQHPLTLKVNDQYRQHIPLAEQIKKKNEN